MSTTSPSSSHGGDVEALLDGTAAELVARWCSLATGGSGQRDAKAELVSPPSTTGAARARGVPTSSSPGLEPLSEGGPATSSSTGCSTGRHLFCISKLWRRSAALRDSASGAAFRATSAARSRSSRGPRLSGLTVARMETASFDGLSARAAWTRRDPGAFGSSRSLTISLCRMTSSHGSGASERSCHKHDVKPHISGLSMICASPGLRGRSTC
mmetsp:Transcript_27894/g.90801  ORF Transcript_27894/g.90801 Transcript_27894/m.90801 type:complete len:213 (-) Transcript_27894:124-762(-)